MPPSWPEMSDYHYEDEKGEPERMVDPEAPEVDDSRSCVEIEEEEVDGSTQQSSEYSGEEAGEDEDGIAYFYSESDLVCEDQGPRGVHKLLASEDSGYGLDKCFTLTLGYYSDVSIRNDADLPQEALRTIIEETMFPIGLATEPDSNYVEAIEEEVLHADDNYEIGRGFLREGDMMHVELLIHDNFASEVVKAGQSIISGEKPIDEVPQVFANFLDFLEAVKDLGWVKADASVSRKTFAKLNNTLNGMLQTFTDEQLGLIGPKSRQFVIKAAAQLTRDAAGLARDLNNLAEWSGSTGSRDEFLPTKRTRKEARRYSC